ncbi:methyltransferase [Neomegalonema sp.]|uniref:class I SAM-dependent methyltransferase n=1 Tax=Neomegalonema sp. TaxID=2039713 RepID=UPI0026394332|nr:50S ribosomal protein L11 methyltransferase [Neomegalonema sp.]MDD2869118.1 50S ribosomal protein L11 methyltransferase [Neomegalonema sp.]
MALRLDDEAALEDFVRRNTAVTTPPLLPELRHHAATEITPIWEMAESELEREGLPPPFWAFAWAGGQALARHALDHPGIVKGRRVLCFASGAGLEAVAASLAGAARVWANDVDPLALAASRLNAALNGASLETIGRDLLAPGAEAPDAEVIFAGDICYEKPLAALVEARLRSWSAEGRLVLLGDPGRTYLPRSGLERVAGYAVKTTRAIEDADVRNAVVWRVPAPS